MIAAGQQWKFLWQEVGNNGDGIVGTDDGALLLAQNDNSKVLKLDQERQDVGRVLRHAHRRRAVDEQEEGAVHRRARPARERDAAHAAAQGTGGQLSGRAARLHRRRHQRSHRRQQGRRVLHDGRRLLRRSQGCRHEVRHHHAERDRSQRRREDALRHQRSGDRGVRRAAGWLTDEPA